MACVSKIRPPSRHEGSKMERTLALRRRQRLGTVRYMASAEKTTIDGMRKELQDKVDRAQADGKEVDPNVLGDLQLVQNEIAKLDKEIGNATAEIEGIDAKFPQ